MERHCRIHGNYGFFLGSSGGCPSCKSDKASAKRDRDRARDDAKRDRERAREEAQARHRENQRNTDRTREEAQSRHRENNQRREERQWREPQQTFRQTPRFVDESSRMELSRQLEAARVEKDRQEKAERERVESQIKQAREKKDQEERELAEKELQEKERRGRLEQEERAEQKRREKTEIERLTQGIVQLEQELGIKEQEKVAWWQKCLGVLMALGFAYLAFCYAAALTGSGILGLIGGGIVFIIFIYAIIKG